MTVKKSLNGAITWLFSETSGTQAMALEAENGKLPQGEEDELKRRGLFKKTK